VTHFTSSLPLSPSFARRTPRTHFHTCWRSVQSRDGLVERVDTSLEGGVFSLETEPAVEPLGDRVWMLVQEGLDVAGSSVVAADRTNVNLAPVNILFLAVIE